MKKGIVGILGAVVGAVAGGIAIGRLSGKSIEQKSEKIDKFKGYYNMLNQWLALKQKGQRLEKYFVDNGYKTIAIYGMGEMGNRLYDELCDTEIKVKYAIDKVAGSTFSELDVREVDSELDAVDAVIVTAIFAFDEICEELEDKLDCPLISLDDVIYEL